MQVGQTKEQNWTLDDWKYIMQARQISHQAAGPREQDEEGVKGAEARGLLQAVTGGFAKELAALREGMVYISAPNNRCVSTPGV